MKTRTIRQTLPAEKIDMGGLPVRQALPTQNVEQISPFLLLHHSGIPTPAGSQSLHTGVPPHPHRGFAPVTIVLEGEVHHRDSLGNSSVVGAGGVQWIHAGRGIIHSERPSDAVAKKGGRLSVIQLWINIPASAKMDTPWYKAMPAQSLPKIQLAEGVEMSLITGVYGDASGPVKSASPVLLATVTAGSGSSATIELPTDYNGAVYITKGAGSFEGFGISEQFQLLHLNNDGDGFTFTASEDTHLVVMAGVPIDEPMAHYGPFVMNTQTQIMEALRDYQMGKMGILVEEQ